VRTVEKNNLILFGIFGIRDTLRHGVYDAVKTCKKNNKKTKKQRNQKIIIKLIK
jgi:magnesium-transporting ATPase (P-type)